MYFYNRENGLGIGIETLPGQKRPGLMMIDELGSKKVAIFIKDEDAEDFVAHLDKMLKAGQRMNHNYAHCAGFRPDCPKECFRAELVRDLKLHITDIRLPVTWMDFRGTTECVRKDGDNK